MNLMEALIAAKLGGGGGGSGLTDDVKQALLQCFKDVAWKDAESGAADIAALTSAFYTIDSIAAVYTQSGTVYDTDSLDSLKADLVVTATYDGGGTSIIPASEYTLSGTLTAGTSTITVSYAGETTTFEVTVTSSVPIEYQRVEYIEAASAGPVIDTNVSMSADYEVRAGVMQYTTGNSTGIFGQTSPSIVMWQASALYANFARLTSKSNGSYSLTSAVRNVVLNKNKLSIDNEEVFGFTGDLQEFQGVRTMMIFAWPENDDNTPYRKTSGKCTYFKIYSGDTEICNLVPCYRKADGVIGMYDTVAQAFRTNIGTGTFTKGSDVNGV